MPRAVECWTSLRGLHAVVFEQAPRVSVSSARIRSCQSRRKCDGKAQSPRFLLTASSPPYRPGSNPPQPDHSNPTVSRSVTRSQIQLAGSPPDIFRQPFSHDACIVKNTSIKIVFYAILTFILCFQILFCRVSRGAAGAAFIAEHIKRGGGDDGSWWKERAVSKRPNGQKSSGRHTC